jgi:hypothetical protein
MILIFCAKNIVEKIGFLTQNKAKLFKTLIITLLFFEKNANFFSQKIGENRRKFLIVCNIDPCSYLIGFAAELSLCG